MTEGPILQIDGIPYVFLWLVIQKHSDKVFRESFFLLDFL